MVNPTKHVGRRPYLGSHQVRQDKVVQWHAHITQIEDSVKAIRARNGYLDHPELDRELNDILADLGALKGHLPPIQTELPFK